MGKRMNAIRAWMYKVDDWMLAMLSEVGKGMSQLEPGTPTMTLPVIRPSDDSGYQGRHRADEGRPSTAQAIEGLQTEMGWNLGWV